MVKAMERYKNLFVTPKQMKMLEEESDKAGVSYEKLMENAGIALALNLKLMVRTVEERDIATRQSEVIFLCGNGNNAGDCFVAARFLKKMKINSKIFLLCGEPKTELAKLNFERMNDIPVIRDEQEMLENLKYSLIDIKVDGVFGTGFHGELPENVKSIFSKCNGLVFAADIPSGGNSKTGAIAEGTMKANLTLAFGCQKIGMAQYPLKEYCGNIKACNIEIPESVYELIDYSMTLIDDDFVKASIPNRKNDSHKGDFGRLLNVCGSMNMPGAAIMSACSATRCGVGLLTVCAPKEYVPHFASKLPEAMFLPLEVSPNGIYLEDSYNGIMRLSSKATTVLIGCGLGVDDESRNLVKKLLLNLNCPIILDADGINCISDSIDIIRQTKSEIILTPHPAEMARLCGVSTVEIQSDRLEYAKTFAKEYNCTVVLKGAGTIIANPKEAFVSLTGNSGMSKGGSGDVLSGIIASLVAQGINPAVGVYIHGKAGDNAAQKYSMQSMLPTDMIDELGRIFKEYEKE